MHSFEIAEHGILERDVRYSLLAKKNSKRKLETLTMSAVGKDIVLVNRFKIVRKYSKRIKKERKKVIKRLRRLLYPNVFRPAL